MTGGGGGGGGGEAEDWPLGYDVILPIHPNLQVKVKRYICNLCLAVKN